MTWAAEEDLLSSLKSRLRAAGYALYAVPGVVGVIVYYCPTSDCCHGYYGFYHNATLWLGAGVLFLVISAILIPLGYFYTPQMHGRCRPSCLTGGAAVRPAGTNSPYYNYASSRHQGRGHRPAIAVGLSGGSRRNFSRGTNASTDRSPNLRGLVCKPHEWRGGWGIMDS